MLTASDDTFLRRDENVGWVYNKDGFRFLIVYWPNSTLQKKHTWHERVVISEVRCVAFWAEKTDKRWWVEGGWSRSGRDDSLTRGRGERDGLQSAADKESVSSRSRKSPVDGALNQLRITWQVAATTASYGSEGRGVYNAGGGSKRRRDSPLPVNGALDERDEEEAKGDDEADGGGDPRKLVLPPGLARPLTVGQVDRAQ
eukprot:6195119-Pleurochrysis_carterae.AAC.1